MTKTEALQALDKLDAYWSEPRSVAQSVGSMWSDLSKCGCFGAHCAKALDLRFAHYSDYSEEIKYEFCHVDGAEGLEKIARVLGMGQASLDKILQNYSGSYSSFNSEEWLTHPNQAWPLISKELRKLAA